MFLGINVIIFLILNKIDFIHYAISDDFFAQNLLNGAHGDYYIFFQQTNVALNGLLASLYKIMPAVNWYGVFNFAVLTVSASFTGAVLTDKFTIKIGLPVYLATVPVFYGAILLYFTYTTVCYGALAGSFVCLLYGFFVEKIKLRRLFFIISAILLCVAVLIRWEGIYSAFVYAFVIALWFLFRYRKRSLRAVLTLLIAFGIAFCFFGVDKAYYNSSPELSEYIDFNMARSDLEDKAPLDYELYAPVFLSVDWTPVDVQRIGDFYLPDDEKINTENMRHVYEQMRPTRYNLDFNNIINQIYGTFSDYFVYGNLCLFIFLILVWLTNKNIWTRILSVIIALLPYLFYALFIVLWRPAFRVTYPHFILSIIIMPMLIDQNKITDIRERLRNTADDPSKPVTCAIALITVFAAVGFANMLIRAKWINNDRTGGTGVMSDSVPIAFEQMSLNSDYAFVYAPPASPLLGANEYYGIFDAFQKDYLKNSQLLGGWVVRSPEYEDFKKRYDIKALPADLLNNGKLLFVMPEGGLTQQYFAQEFGVSVGFEDVIELAPGITACRVISTE